ncbi:hypothetical protein WN944_006592 [Citrus x changshan-huyou]|uniref:Aminoacyl-tRNA synthetase class II (D/K/N) domain-containing protein n=1 Tax=Citrus x changshan-huyou TaxID=2935761 RepID=A0AAP0MLM1_9ROSI
MGQIGRKQDKDWLAFFEGVLAIPPVGAGIKQKIELRVKKVIDVGLVAADGCGEMFQVTTLLSEAEKLEKELMKNPPPSEADREAAKLFVKEKGEGVAKLKSKKASKEEGKHFENKVEWGIDLVSEHERKPVTVYNYPKGVKAFYMRLNDDLATVAAMDVVVPKVGELIGGSQREERYGVIKSSGFGLGFERMVLFATGMDNIRDALIRNPQLRSKWVSGVMRLSSTVVVDGFAGHVFASPSGMNAVSSTPLGHVFASPSGMNAVSSTPLMNALKDLGLDVAKGTVNTEGSESSEQLAMGEAFAVKAPEKKLLLDIATHIHVKEDGPERSDLGNANLSGQLVSQLGQLANLQYL